MLLVTGTYRQTAGRASIALSPNADVVVIATANILYFYDAWTTILDATIEFVCSGKKEVLEANFITAFGGQYNNERGSSSYLMTKMLVKMKNCLKQ